MSNIRNMIVAASLGLSVASAMAQTADNRPSRSDRAFQAELLSDSIAPQPAANSNTVLHVNGDLQFRYTANFGRENVSRNDFEGGFSLPLTRLRFNGNVNGFDYTVVGAFNEDDGNASLQDAFVGYGWNNYHLQMGQFRLPFMHEVNVDEIHQLSASRSVVADIFGQGRSQGVQMTADAGNFRFTGAFSDGFGSENTSFTNDSETDAAFTGRVDWLLNGSFASYNDFTSEVGSEASTIVGAAAHYEDGQDHRAFAYTADFSFERNGFNAFAAGVGRNVEDNGSDSLTDWALMGQAGYRITNNVELFGRYEYVAPDGDRNIRDDYNFVTGGVNYYMFGHAAKLTADAVYSVNSTDGLDSMGDFSDTALLGSTDEGETALRLQFQLVF